MGARASEITRRRRGWGPARTMARRLRIPGRCSGRALQPEPEPSAAKRHERMQAAASTRDAAARPPVRTAPVWAAVGKMAAPSTRRRRDLDARRSTSQRRPGAGEKGASDEDERGAGARVSRLMPLCWAPHTPDEVQRHQAPRQQIGQPGSRGCFLLKKATLTGGGVPERGARESDGGLLAVPRAAVQNTTGH